MAESKVVAKTHGQGSTVVLIRIKPRAALDDAQVQVVAGVARDVDPTPECLSYLLRENHDFVLGAFAWRVTGTSSSRTRSWDPNSTGRSSRRR